MPCAMVIGTIRSARRSIVPRSVARSRATILREESFGSRHEFAVASRDTSSLRGTTPEGRLACCANTLSLGGGGYSRPTCVFAMTLPSVKVTSIEEPSRFFHR